jgi:glycosyltransferase involved in cell wall biosynthesis
MIPETKETNKQGARRHEAGAVKPLRVLIVAPSLDILGGQAVQAARLLEGLRREPLLEVGFLPINPRLPKLLRWMQAIKYVRTVVTSLAYVWTLLVRVPGYDLLHVFSASYFSFLLAPTPAILIARLYRKKVVLNYHSGEAADHLARWPSAVRTLRLADAVVVQTNYLVEVFARFHLAARAIPNHLEKTALRFAERTPLHPVFLSNRNLEPHYNVGCVLRAFAIIQRETPDARLTVVGDGSQRVELERLARELDLRDVRFLGLVTPDQMAELYNEANIFLNGSEIDSMPISILEAFAGGLLVVTTDAGGIPWMVRDKETGLIVRRGDYQALAQAALQLLRNEKLAAALAANARREVEKYSWPRVRDAWLKVYGEVARGVDVERAAESDGQRTNENVRTAERNANANPPHERREIVSTEREAVSR